MANVETTGVVGPRNPRTYFAGAAAMKRGYALVQGADDNHAALAGANAVILGIQEEDTINAGDPVSVIREGEAVAVIGAAVAAGQFLVTDSLGRLVPAGPGAQNTAAQAVSSGSSAGDWIVVVVTRQAVFSGDTPVTYFTVGGALPVVPGTYILNGAGALAMTLAAPAVDGIVIKVLALTAHAHTVTTPANKINGADDTATFASAVGNNVVLESINGLWLVQSSVGITLSEV